MKKENKPPPCQICKGKCCSYFALEIDKPKKKAEFENLRWYLLHKKTFIFVEDREWFLQINTPCKHLSDNYHCTIYKDRPSICREYGTNDIGHIHCDHTTDNEKHDLEFTSALELEKYIKKRFPSKKKK